MKIHMVKCQKKTLTLKVFMNATYSANFKVFFSFSYDKYIRLKHNLMGAGANFLMIVKICVGELEGRRNELKPSYFP